MWVISDLVIHVYRANVMVIRRGVILRPENAMIASITLQVKKLQNFYIHCYCNVLKLFTDNNQLLNEVALDFENYTVDLRKFYSHHSSSTRARYN